MENLTYEEWQEFQQWRQQSQTQQTRQIPQTYETYQPYQPYQPTPQVSSRSRQIDPYPGMPISREGREPRPSQPLRPSLTTDALALHARMGGLNLNVNPYGNSHVGRSVPSHNPGVFAESPLPPPGPTQLEITKQRIAAGKARLAQLDMEEAEYNRKRQERQLEEQLTAAEAKRTSRENISVGQPQDNDSRIPAVGKNNFDSRLPVVDENNAPVAGAPIPWNNTDFFLALGEDSNKQFPGLIKGPMNGLPNGQPPPLICMPNNLQTAQRPVDTPAAQRGPPGIGASQYSNVAASANMSGKWQTVERQPRGQTQGQMFRTILQKVIARGEATEEEMADNPNPTPKETGYNFDRMDLKGCFPRDDTKKSNPYGKGRVYAPKHWGGDDDDDYDFCYPTWMTEDECVHAAKCCHRHRELSEVQCEHIRRCGRKGLKFLKTALRCWFKPRRPADSGIPVPPPLRRNNRNAEKATIKTEVAEHPVKNPLNDTSAKDESKKEGAVATGGSNGGAKEEKEAAIGSSGSSQTSDADNGGGINLATTGNADPFEYVSGWIKHTEHCITDDKAVRAKAEEEFANSPRTQYELVEQQKVRSQVVDKDTRVSQRGKEERRKKVAGEGDVAEGSAPPVKTK